MKYKKDSLGDRMKTYENQFRIYLDPKEPVIIRIDGRAFHTFTRGFNRPFDNVFAKAMSETMKYLCENIQNCVFGYTQSDEITLILVNDFNPDSCAWFDNNLQKIASISASMATMAFNKFFAQEVDRWGAETFEWEWYEGGTNDPEVVKTPEWKLAGIYSKAIDNGAMFDTRAFTIPKDEIINCLIWRQQDAIRNSIQSCGQAIYSHQMLHGKNSKEILEMLASDNMNWEKQPTMFKYGSCCVKDDVKEVNGAIRTKWRIDYEIPIFTENREYVNKWLYAKEDIFNA